jgi:hypothetical protein
VRARLPAGHPSRGLGTGYGEIGPFLGLSTGLIDGWLDSHLDAGVDAGIGDLRRSSAHYGWARSTCTRGGVRNGGRSEHPS